MPIKRKGYSRREFIKTSSAVGAGALLGGINPYAFGASIPIGPIVNEDLIVSTRPFGKSGVNVPILAFGGVVDFVNSQILLNYAYEKGVRYWDTAHEYLGGRSEKGIGKFLARYPEKRDKLFLVTKSAAFTRFGLTRHLDQSLKRMGTNYVDMFMLHGINRMDGFTVKLRRWVEEAKAAGKMRLFGFSTHFNIYECLSKAAKIDWIDGIMMTYNYRTDKVPQISAAINDCHKAGIGLTAMKTMGLASSSMGLGVKSDLQSYEQDQFVDKFVQFGCSPEQAKLRVVWNNRAISSICSQMPTKMILDENIAAAMDWNSINSEAIKSLETYARQTSGAYCLGCTQICESAVDHIVPIGDVMRCLMYARKYDSPKQALGLFSGISGYHRKTLATLDYSIAERVCPQKIPIGKFIKESLELFA